jgi:hypothetical protein
MVVLEFIKTVSNIPKLDYELRLLNSKYNSLTIKDDNLRLIFNASLIQTEVDAVSNLVNNFVELCVREQIKLYISKQISPFIEDFTYKIISENMELGITQMGKTAEVLGFYCDRVEIPGKNRAVSLQDTLDSNSLTVTIEVLNYYLDNPQLYSDLSPFITTARIEGWIAEIQALLA